MDTFSKKERSAIMRAVKSDHNLSTELNLINLFHKYKIREWRRHQNIFGKPDFYFPKLKIALFADGCFWHGCRCKKLKPVTNKKYWSNKIKNNIKRDKMVNSELNRKGYVVIRIKECSIKKGVLPRKLLVFFNSSHI
jgi:DNA mismatch endonuclease (patch repair protein)